MDFDEWFDKSGMSHMSVCNAMTRAAWEAGRKARQDWIPVDERLPDIGKRVPVIDADYMNEKQPLIAYRYETTNSKDGWFWQFLGESKLVLITHWMPLPPAPEADDE